MIPYGKFFRTPEGQRLVYERTYRAPVADVWASITESERLSRWYGSWTGKPGAGETINLTMLAEEGEPTFPIEITACEPPRYLALSVAAWTMEITLKEADGGTAVVFVHHLAPSDSAKDYGAGWDYYMDRLEAAIAGTPVPGPDAFPRYSEALDGHYAAITAD